MKIFFNVLGWIWAIVFITKAINGEEWIVQYAISIMFIIAAEIITKIEDLKK